MTATLNYDLRNGLEFGTDEMGIANLKMILDFVSETIFDTLLIAAQAQDQGMSDTSLVSLETLSHIAYDDLKKQDEEAAYMWNQSWSAIIANGDFVAEILERMEGILKVDAQSLDESGHMAEVLLFLDLDALNAAVA